MPRVTGIIITFDLPATKLLVEPPAIVAIPHFEIREPFGDDGNQCSVETYTDA